MVKDTKRVTFRLVSASNADNRSGKLPWQRTLVLKESQNDLWKNRPSNHVPRDLLKNLDPHDFGIHENLTGSQKEYLIKNIYGSREAFKQFERPVEVARQTAVPAEEDLDGDCYFPKDGYDYEQHLATINPKYFIPAPKIEEPANGSMDIENDTDFPELAGFADSKDPEVNEVLEALESDNDLEAIDDDFVAQAMEGAYNDIDEDKILWGDYKPTIPSYILDRQLEVQQTGSSHEPDNTEPSQLPLQDESEAEMGEDSTSEMRSETVHFKNYIHYDPNKKDRMSVLNPTEVTKDKILQLLDHESDGEASYESPGSSESEDWDVETILTTYTNATNHPKMILSRRIKVPKANTAKENGTNKHKTVDVDHVHFPEVNTLRLRGESSEEKRERKLAVKKTKALIKEVKRNNKEALKEAKKKNTLTNSRGAYDVTNGVKYLKL